MKPGGFQPSTPTSELIPAFSHQGHRAPARPSGVVPILARPASCPVRRRMEIHPPSQIDHDVAEAWDGPDRLAGQFASRQSLEQPVPRGSVEMVKSDQLAQSRPEIGSEYRRKVNLERPRKPVADLPYRLPDSSSGSADGIEPFIGYQPHAFTASDPGALWVHAFDHAHSTLALDSD